MNLLNGLCGALCALAIMVSAPRVEAQAVGGPLPVANYAVPADIAPVGPVTALDLFTAGMIEGDVAFENLNVGVSSADARPDVLLEFYLDRGLSNPIRDINGFPVAIVLEGTTAGGGLPGFDGSLDTAGPSGFTHTVSPFFRQKTVHVDVLPAQQAQLGATRRVWMKVRQWGRLRTHGHWWVEIHQVRAAVTCSVVVTSAPPVPLL